MVSGERLGGGYAAPVVARWGGQPLEIGGPENPSTPLIVLLHGRGSHENTMVGLAPHLPFGPAYAAVRGPVEESDGFTWSAGDDLDATMDWFLGWLDTEGDPDRPVVLVGFAEGATLAAALMLNRPERWAGGVLLHGALPPAAPLTRGRLTGMPVFLAQATGSSGDPQAPAYRTWDYLVRDSGAPVWAERDPGGQRLTGELVAAVDRWLTARLDHLHRFGENPLPDGDDPPWPTLPEETLPPRAHRPEADGTPAVLPIALAYDAVGKGWAVADPLAGLTLPAGAVVLDQARDDAEHTTISAIAAAPSASAS
ncbi:MAG: phospholipase/carboxylesterase [Pseudonocardiales bacterium]|nr:phospholipase/carboxylesterase [Pseudonocardiales bacterium]